jgi:thioredoxin reductase (NADPH)
MLVERMIVDVAIIGAGPVGLHAALKAVLLNMSAVVVDKGRKRSRAFFIPRLENIPGLPGVSGARLMELQRQNLGNYRDRVQIIDDTEVIDIAKERDIFVLKCAGRQSAIKARTVLLATGLIDRQPEIGGTIRKILPFANRNLVHYCILCDGHTAKQKSVCVVGHSSGAVSVALDLLYFEASSVTLLTHGMDLEDQNDLERLREKSISVVSDEILDLVGLEKQKFGVVLKSGETRHFDSGFVWLGYYHTGVELGLKLGGHPSEDGFLVTSEDGQLLSDDSTPIEDVFAVGDVRNSWNQIPIGWGDAEKAIVSIFSMDGTTAASA